jgi:ribonucleoside-diphosphate reductase, beta subunit
MKAVNWNKQDDLIFMYWNQNIQQFWLDTEFKVSKDIADWNALSTDQQDTYKKVLAGLTGLDTQQGNLGMNVLGMHVEDMRLQAVYAYMSFIEGVHAKSYSTIFTSLLDSRDTDYLLDEWVPTHPRLTYKAERIVERYNKLVTLNPSAYDVYMAHVASVFLESFLFYSGFFYPLYLAGQGKMTTSGEIIRKIMLDETLHGSCVGYSAQEIYKTLTPEEQAKADEELYMLLEDLFQNEVAFTHELYDKIDLADQVIDYVKYNGNRALQNLGREAYFEHGPINPIIENALNTSSKNHDFFSTKGDSYVVPVNVEEMTDDDWDF